MAERSTAAIIVEHGRVLIARRKAGGALGGKWEFPGGKCESGEDPRQALSRELEEELSVGSNVGERVATASFEHDGVAFTLQAYVVHLGSHNMVLSEHEEVRWIPPEELYRVDLAASDRKLLPALKSHLETYPHE